MIPKEIKYNLHYDDVRGDFYGRHAAQHQLPLKKAKAERPRVNKSFALVMINSQYVV